MTDPYSDLRAVDAPYVPGSDDASPRRRTVTVPAAAPAAPVLLGAPRRTGLEIARDVSVTIAAVLLSVVLALVLYVVVRAGAALSRIGEQGGPGVITPSTAPWVCEPAFPGDTTCPK